VAIAIQARTEVRNWLNLEGFSISVNNKFANSTEVPLFETSVYCHFSCQRRLCYGGFAGCMVRLSNCTCAKSSQNFWVKISVKFSKGVVVSQAILVT